jgi:hypothetical protein
VLGGLKLSAYFVIMVPIGLVYSIYDSTEVAIKKMIKASQRMINEQLNSPPVNEHFKLKIKTLLQNAPRDEEKLERLLQVKQRQKEAAMHT